MVVIIKACHGPNYPVMPIVKDDFFVGIWYLEFVLIDNTLLLTLFVKLIMS